MIDWSIVVSNLCASGMSVKGIAKRCKMEAQTASRLQNGTTKEPRWTQGIMLLDLHSDVCGERHSLEALRR